MNSPRPHALVAIDVDGTLVNSSHVVAAATKDAVEGLDRRGVGIIIASSRSPEGIRHAANGLDLNDLWICGYQGAVVLQPGSDWKVEPVLDHAIGATTADSICEIAASAGISIGRHYNNTWFVDALTAEVEREAAITGETPLMSDDLTELGTPAHKLQIISSRHETQALHDIRDQMPPSTKGVFSHANYLEVTNAKADKADGIALIAERLGIEPNRIAAIGDGDNDLGMLGFAGISIAMGNGTENVKRAADVVVADNDHGGVVEAAATIADFWSLRTSTSGEP